MQFKGNANMRLKNPGQGSWVKIIKVPFQFAKKVFFSSYYELLKISESSKVGAFFCLTVFWTQILLMPFADNFRREWQFDQITYYLNAAFNVLSVAPAISSLGFVAHLVMCLVFVCLLLVQLFGLVVISKKNAFQNVNSELVTNGIKWLQRAGMTLLSLPYLLAFATTFSCTYSESAALVLSFSQETRCFEGLHLLESVVAALGLVLHVVLTGTACLWYFETSYLKDLPFAQAPSLLNTIAFIYQILFVVLGIYASQNGIEYLTIVVLIAVSLLMAYAYVTSNPFYSQRVAAFSSACSLLNTWGVAMLLVSRVAEGNWIRGSLVVWMAVLPFVVFSSLRWKKGKIGLLLVTIDRVQTGETILAHLMYLLQLIQKSTIDEECIILLEGFIENHICHCSQVDCPLPLAKATEKRSPESSDVQLIKYIDFVYREATVKFPSHVELNISYAFFLLEIAKKPQEALSRLENISLLKHGFRFSFIISRGLTSLQEIRLDATLMGPDDGREKAFDVNEVPLQSLLKKFTNQMEEAVLLHSEVWGHLQEETPNLKRLLNLGKSILFRLDKISKIWQNFYRHSLSNRTQYLLCYGKFLTSVVNDVAGGHGLIEEARRLTMMIMNRRSDLNFMSIDQDISEIAVPMVAVSGSKLNFGSIIKVNSLAAIFFGYTTGDLIGQNVKKLIPKTFNMHHDAYLGHSVKTRSLVFMEKARTVFAKTGNGYLTPLVINVKAIFGLQPMFYAQVRSLKSFEVCAYLLTDYKGRVETGSSGIIQLFGLSLVDFEGSPSINNFFKDLFDHRERIMGNGEEVLDLTTVDPKMRSHIASRRIIRVSVETHQHYLMIKEYYVFKFTSEIVVPLVVSSAPFKQCEFQFEMNREHKQLVGRLTRSKDDDCEEDNHTESFTKRKKKKELKRESLEDECIFLTHDIKLYRLDAGKIVEIDEDHDQNEAVIKELADTNKLEREKLKRDEDLLSQQIIKRIGTFKDQSKLRSKMPVPKSAKIYLLVIAAVLACIAVVIVVAFQWKQKLFARVPHYHSFYTNYTLIINDLMNASQAIQRLIVVNNLPKTTVTEEDLRRFLGFVGKNLQNGIASLEISSKDVQDPIFEDLLINNKIVIMTDASTTQEMSFLASVKYMITTILIMQDMPLEQFRWEEGNIIVRYVDTIFKHASDKLIASSAEIIDQLDELLSDSKPILVIQILKALLAIVGFAATLFYKRFALKKVNECMQLFLDVPAAKGRRYLSQCEVFLQRLETKLYDEYDIDDEEVAEFEEDQSNRANVVSRKRRRSKALKIALQKSLIVKYAFAASFVLVVLVIGFIIENSSNKSIKSRNVDISLIGQMSPLYHGFLTSHISEYIEFATFKQLSEEESTKESMSMFYKMNKFNNDLDQLFINNTNQAGSLYSTTIAKIRQDSLCTLLNLKEYLFEPFYKPRADECDYLSQDEATKKIVSNGLSIALNVYQKALQRLEFELQNLGSMADRKKSVMMSSQSCKDTNYVDLFCTLESEIFEQAFLVQNYYVSYFSKQMLGLFNENITNRELPRAQNIGVCLLVANIFSLVWLTWWLVVRGFLHDYRELKKAKRIVFIIPLEHVENSPEIRRFYQKLLDEIN